MGSLKCPGLRCCLLLFSRTPPKACMPPIPASLANMFIVVDREAMRTQAVRCRPATHETPALQVKKGQISSDLTVYPACPHLKLLGLVTTVLEGTCGVRAHDFTPFPCYKSSPSRILTRAYRSLGCTDRNAIGVFAAYLPAYAIEAALTLGYARSTCYPRVCCLINGKDRAALLTCFPCFAEAKRHLYGQHAKRYTKLSSKSLPLPSSSTACRQDVHHRIHGEGAYRNACAGGT